MRFKINLLLPLLCLCFFIGCSFTPSELKIAEQIIDSKPDSALRILKNIKSENITFNPNRALYGLLMFQALDNCDKPLRPDSILNFSIEYYQKKNDQTHLAKCYFYKARKYKYAQRYDEATLYYFKALDYSGEKKDDTLLGKIYGDIGYICSFQLKNKEVRDIFRISLKYFKLTNETNNIYYKTINIGRTYSKEKKFKTAEKYFRYVLRQTKDSLIYGVAYQEIGASYYENKQLDSAQYYLRKSLKYPYRGTNYAIKCYTLADVLFDLAQYDSSHHYASHALKYPANFYTQRECYRILVNIEYLRKDIKQMSKYMTQYQNCSDSVRKVEAQTKFKVLENLHNANKKAKGAKRDLSLVFYILLISLFLSAFAVYALYKRNKLKKNQLDSIKEKLNQKQLFVSLGLAKKIKDAKALQADVRKGANPEEKARLDKRVYDSILHLNEWETFKAEMNHAFNQIIDKLESNYPEVTKREIIWCCLQLLEIPNNDRMILLDTTSDSLYKLKQRLAQKMNLQSTKELDNVLKKLATI